MGKVDAPGRSWSWGNDWSRGEPSAFYKPSVAAEPPAAAAAVAAGLAAYMTYVRSQETAATYMFLHRDSLAVSPSPLSDHTTTDVVLLLAGKQFSRLHSKLWIDFLFSTEHSPN
ncbi:hypothetical protein PGTUg99_033101 [Puccinia graminis f. sp. tritici]|uniref:Uncharacterized protein n=1 Tax=Puccinia graminis f. sp. tritici TaxID=56615 RepID=A0A5B0MHH9_PUCGR|nr:hypothetical protein PGTUg99_033101 [Puccinia graminis f. sp. tritici]